jgi:hypothetical protein
LILRKTIAAIADFLLLNHLGFIVLAVFSWQRIAQDGLSAGIVTTSAALLALNWHWHPCPWLNPPSPGRIIGDVHQKLVSQESDTLKLLPYWALAFSTMLAGLSSIFDPTFGVLYSAQELILNTGGLLLLWVGVTGFFAGYAALAAAVMVSLLLFWFSEPMESSLVMMVISAQLGLLVLLWLVGFWFFNNQILTKTSSN